jgi:phage terminase small subunit
MVFDMGVKLGFMPKAKKKDYECLRRDNDDEEIFYGN